MIDFGPRLKRLRLQHNLTQSQLAEKLFITKSVVSAYETGFRTPSYEVLIAMSKLFDVTTDYLLGIKKKEEEETENQQFVDLSGLSDDQINALINLVRSMKKED